MNVSNVSGGSGRHCLQDENSYSSSLSGKKTLKFHCQVRRVARMNLMVTRRNLLVMRMNLMVMRTNLVVTRMNLMVTRMNLMMILIFSVACYQNDRDRLREFLISWFQISAKKQPWYRSVNQILVQVNQSKSGTGQSIRPWYRNLESDNVIILWFQMCE